MIVSLRRLVCAAAVACTAAAPARADVDIERVSFVRSADGHTIVARVHTTDRVRAYSVDQEGDDVELVIYEAHLARRIQRGSPQQPVQGYRIEADGDRVTLRFDVDPAATVQAYPDRDSDDLLLAFSAPAATPTVRPAGPRPAAPVVPVSATADAERWRLDTIVLDAGHGDHDHGARANGTSDKEVALGVVLRLGRMIERELGVRVVYTRDDDTFVPRRERGRIANRQGGKLFISVHANAAASTSAYGTETFFLALRGDPSAREVMARENAVVREESDPALYEEAADEAGGILQALAVSAYREESQTFAALVEREFAASGRHSRGVKQANFDVLWAASMPAVLIETGFITNRDEARFLASADGQEKTARAIFNAVRAYKEIYERGLH